MPPEWRLPLRMLCRGSLCDEHICCRCRVPACQGGAPSASVVALDETAGTLFTHGVLGPRPVPACLQVSVSLPAGMTALQLTDKRGRAASLRASGGVEALQAEFSASQAVVTAVDRAPAEPEIIEDELFENERAVPGLGFRAAHLMPLDPQQCDSMTAAVAVSVGYCQHCVCAVVVMLSTQ